MKNRKNFLSASVALAALLFVSVNIDAALVKDDPSLQIFNSKLVDFDKKLETHTKLLNQCVEEIATLGARLWRAEGEIEGLKRILTVFTACTEQDIMDMFASLGNPFYGKTRHDLSTLIKRDEERIKNHAILMQRK